MAKETQNAKTNIKVPFVHSIKNQLIALMLGIAIIPLLIAIIVSYTTSSKKAMADAQDSLEWQAWYIEATFQSIIEQNMDMIRQVGENPTILAYITAPESGIGDDVIMSTLKGVDDVLGDGNATTLTGADGMQLFRTDGGNLVDVHEREYFKQAMNGQPYMSDVITSASTGTRQVTFAAPVKDAAGNCYGIVQRNYNLDDIHEFLAEESEDAFIVDRTGLVAAHAQYKIGPGEHEEDYRDKSEFMVSGKDEGFYFVDTGKGYDAYVAYVKEPNTKFTVCTASNSKTVLGSSRQAVTIVVIIGIIMAIIVAIIAVVAGRLIMLPIYSVCESLTHLADGQFQKVDLTFGEKGEFGVMVKSVNTVVDRLSSIVANIKASAAGVADSSEELSDMANQISQTAEDVSNAVQ